MNQASFRRCFTNDFFFNFYSFGKFLESNFEKPFAISALRTSNWSRVVSIWDSQIKTLLIEFNQPPNEITFEIENYPFAFSSMQLDNWNPVTGWHSAISAGLLVWSRRVSSLSSRAFKWICSSSGSRSRDQHFDLEFSEFLDFMNFWISKFAELSIERIRIN